jgi:hypothetical protein
MALSGVSAALVGAALGFAFAQATLRARSYVRLTFGPRGLDIGDAYLSYERVRALEMQRAEDGSVLRIHTASGGGYILRSAARTIPGLEDALTSLRRARPAIELHGFGP